LVDLEVLESFIIVHEPFIDVKKWLKDWVVQFFDVNKWLKDMVEPFFDINKWLKNLVE
jgi:hypothetical protein